LRRTSLERFLTLPKTVFLAEEGTTTGLGLPMEKVINPGMTNLPAFTLAFYPCSAFGVYPGMTKNMELPLHHSWLNCGWASTASGKARTEVADEDLLLSATSASAEYLTVSLVGVVFEDGPIAEGGSKYNKPKIRFYSHKISGKQLAT